MEKQYDQHLILKTLDNPMRILFWDLPDFMMLVTPFFLGMILESNLIFFAGIALRSLIKRLMRKKRRGAEKLWAYWHFPTSTINHVLKTKCPPSHVREYLH